MERIPPQVVEKTPEAPKGRSAQQQWQARGPGYGLKALASYYQSGTYRSVSVTATIDVYDADEAAVHATLFFGDPTRTLAFLDDYYTSNGGTPLLPEGLVDDWAAMDALIQAWAAALDTGN